MIATTGSGASAPLPPDSSVARQLLVPSVPLPWLLPDLWPRQLHPLLKELGMPFKNVKKSEN